MVLSDDNSEYDEAETSRKKTRIRVRERIKFRLPRRKRTRWLRNPLGKRGLRLAIWVIGVLIFIGVVYAALEVGNRSGIKSAVVKPSQ
jgi:hypothetical protein